MAIKLKVEKRKVFGRKVKSLRNEGLLPANIYGKKIKSLAVQVSTTEFEKVFAGAGETGIVELTVDTQKYPVLIHHVQLDPVDDNPLHADFVKIDLKEKVTAQVPIELIGESPAEKQGLGTVVLHLDEVEVVSLPTDLPGEFQIDVTKLEAVDDAVLVKDLQYDKNKVEVKEDAEEVIVKVEPLRKEEEEPIKEEITEGEGEAAEGAEAGEGEKEEGKETKQEAPKDDQKEEKDGK